MRGYGDVSREQKLLLSWKQKCNSYYENVNLGRNKFTGNECLANFEVKFRFLENLRKPLILKSMRKCNEENAKMAETRVGLSEENPTSVAKENQTAINAKKVKYLCQKTKRLSPIQMMNWSLLRTTWVQRTLRPCLHLSIYCSFIHQGQVTKPWYIRFWELNNTHQNENANKGLHFFSCDRGKSLLVFIWFRSHQKLMVFISFSNNHVPEQQIKLNPGWIVNIMKSFQESKVWLSEL